MKKIAYSFILLMILMGLLTSCTGKGAAKQNTETPAETASTDRMKIVCTIFPQYDFVRQIVGDSADVVLLLKPGAESHTYEPTPLDIQTILGCDLFIHVGGENDVWVHSILDSMGAEKPETLRLLDLVPTVTVEMVEGMEHDHDHEEHPEGEHAEEEHPEEEHPEEEHSEDEHSEDGHDHESEPDEHIWTSPKNAIEIVQKISARLAETDEENSALYRENSAAYITRLENLDASFRDVTENAKRNTILFGDRFPFRYLADEYGIQYYAAFSGCSTETECSAATIAFLIDRVETEQLPAVFSIEFSNGKIADTIAEATGAERLTMYSCHNVTKDQMEAGATYLSMMHENVESLRVALH